MVPTNFALITINNIKTINKNSVTWLINYFLPLKQMLYIYYPIEFKNNQAKIVALIDFNNNINGIIIAYVAKLGLKIRFINIMA